jgi:gluconolactonase
MMSPGSWNRDGKFYMRARDPFASPFSSPLASPFASPLTFKWGAAFSSVLGFAAAAALGQIAPGSVTLPADLAEPGTQVVSVFAKSAVNGAYLGWCDGPTADASGTVWMGISQDGGGIWKISPDGKAEKVAAGMTQGMELDSQGRLLACNVDSGLRRFEKDGTITVLDKTRVKDLSQGANGSMYLCDHGSMLYFRTAAGELKPIPGQSNATGVKWIEEAKTLYVDDPGKGGVFRFDATADGVLTNRKQIGTYTNTDGMEVDEKGNVYITNWRDGTVEVLNPADNFKVIGKLAIKNANPGDKNITGDCTNLCWGGPGNRTLYITGDGGLYKATLKVAGRMLPGTTAVARYRIAKPLSDRGTTPFGGGYFSGMGRVTYLVPDHFSGHLPGHSPDQQARVAIDGAQDLRR